MVTKEQITAACESTKLPCIHIAPTPDETPGPTDSKFGGGFYLPAGAKAPDMEFLAQINFAQVPHLEGFPEKGLLQFFLTTEESAVEVFFDEAVSWKQNAGFFKTIFYPEPPADAAAQENAVPENRWGFLQDFAAGGMRFQPGEEIATITLGDMGFLTDMGFEEVSETLNALFMAAEDEDEADEDEDDEDDEAYEGYDLSLCGDTDQFCQDFGNWGFKLGGHPSLRSSDFRLDDENFQAYSVLLFQYDLTVPDPKNPMDLEQDTFCFFIKPEDLKACRFDDILMIHHNCY